MIKINKKTLLCLSILFVCFIAWGGVKAEEQITEKPEITDIDIREADSSTEIQIDSNSPFSYTIYKPSDPYRTVVELQDIGLGKFKEKMVIDRAGVMEIIPSEIEGATEGVRLEIALSVPAEIKPLTKGNSLILTFYNPEAMEMPAVALQEEVTEEQRAEVTPFTGEGYVGEKISFDFQDAELLHIFRLLSDVSGYNIIVNPEVKGKISIKLMDVPWDQALDMILKNYGLSKVIENNIIRVAPTTVLAREAEEMAKAKEAEIKAGEIETKIYPINYADVEKVKTTIESGKILTSVGNISTDKRTSSVIIKDIKEKHKEYERLIKALDLPTPQVNIEAKIVEVTTSFTRELGIQWGMMLTPTGKPTGSRMRIGGISSLSGGSGFFSGNPLMVNLPATVGAGAGGVMGVGYVSPNNRYTLDLQLSAMESSGQGKIISNPRITTMDNEKATIKQGKKIPYTTVSDAGTQVEFVNAELELTVTPHITPEETIVMEVEAKKNEADFSQTVGGVPTIDTKEAKTQVLIRDGDTLVIGGIFKTTKSKSLAGVPWFHKIPILGWLFKKEDEMEDTSELLVFITPRIVK